MLELHYHPTDYVSIPDGAVLEYALNIKQWGKLFTSSELIVTAVRVHIKEGTISEPVKFICQGEDKGIFDNTGRLEGLDYGVNMDMLLRLM